MQINPSEFPLGENHFFIEGAVGYLEVLTYAAKNDVNGVGVICHPHPLHQGSMHNKVVYTLSRAFHHRRCHAVRFNFRGVGKSDGQFGNSVGELEDLKAILGWLNLVLPGSKLYLAGFSFGAYIAALGATTYPCYQLISIAPAVINQPYDSLGAIGCPWIMIQGEVDEVIPVENVKDWVERNQGRYPNLKLITFPNTSHFFHGELMTLRKCVEENLID